MTTDAEALWRRDDPDGCCWVQGVDMRAVILWPPIDAASLTDNELDGILATRKQTNMPGVAYIVIVQQLRTFLIAMRGKSGDRVDGGFLTSWDCRGGEAEVREAFYRTVQAVRMIVTTTGGILSSFLKDSSLQGPPWGWLPVTGLPVTGVLGNERTRIIELED